LPAESDFDAVEAWVRQARNQIAQSAALDQTYVRAISLKDVTQTNWQPGLASGQWTFDLPDNLFAGQNQVRLRGIGLAVAGEKEQPLPAGTPPPKTKKEVQKPDGFWTASVNLPAAGSVKYVSGKGRDLDQKALPACFLGRVADQDSPREIEFA